MTKLALLGAAAVVLSSALAGPATAQQVNYNPGYCAQFYPNANCQNLGPGSPYTDNYRRRTAYRTGWDSSARWDDGGRDSRNDNRWERRESGFGPADVAAGVVGGAVAGNNVERNYKEGVSGYRVVVRLNNGHTRTFERTQVGSLRVGDRVTLDANSFHRG